MPKITALVEGQTEETFVRDVLNPYLWTTNGNVYVHAIIVQTKRIKSGEAWRGGITKYSQFRDEALRLLNDSSSVILTSVIDLYHLPKDFPGHAKAMSLSFRDRVTYLERRMREDVPHKKFVPYISTHEFESLVLSDPETVVDVLGATGAAAKRFLRDVNAFESPEHINGEESPSNRILHSFPHYDKVRHGPTSARRIGIESIRGQCEHFASWLANLELVGAETT